MSTTYSGTAVASDAAVGKLTGFRPRVSWSAIFAGVVMAVAIEVLLSILGAGVGFGLINANAGTTPTGGAFGTGTGIWCLASTIIALMIGGYAATRLAGVTSRLDGMLHGLVIWGLTLLLSVYLITSMVTGVLGGTLSALGATVSAAGSAVGSAASGAGSALHAALPQAEQASGLNPNLLQQQAESILQSPASQDPASMSKQDAVKAIGQALPDLMSGGDKSTDAKQRITNIVAAQAHISQQDAQKRVEDAQAKLNDLKNQAAANARQAADASAVAASHLSYLVFIGLLIGAIAAAVGGALASPRDAQLAAGRFR